MPHKKTRLSAVADFLNLVTENYSAVIPLVTLVLGIGMMKFLPESATTPLFPSEELAQKFFQQHQISLPPRVALVLGNETCGPCNELKSQLTQAGIQFVEQNPAVNPQAQPLLEAIKTATGNKDLPKVVIGTKVVKPNVKAIKSELNG
jgi:hypothetical protein